MKLDRALAIAGKARIRRYALPSRTEAPSSPSSERDARGRYLPRWRGGPGRPPRDALRELYVDDLFHVWKRHGRKVIS